MQEDLLKLENLLIKKNAPILSKLNPGIDISTIDLKIIKQLLSSVQELYLWRNGTINDENSTIGQLWIFPMGIFMDIENALDIYNTSLPDLPEYDPGKFPIFRSGGGAEYLLVQCNKYSEYYGMIYFYSIGNIDFEYVISYYDNIESLIETVYTCYKEAVYKYDLNNMLDSDYEKELAITRRLNTKSEYHRLFD